MKNSFEQHNCNKFLFIFLAFYVFAVIFNKKNLIIEEVLLTLRDSIKSRFGNLLFFWFFSTIKNLIHPVIGIQCLALCKTSQFHTINSYIQFIPP